MKPFEDSYLVSGVKNINLNDSVYPVEQVVSLLIISSRYNVKLGSLFYYAFPPPPGLVGLWNYTKSFIFQLLSFQ